jgi:hypothetical protein
LVTDQNRQRRRETRTASTGIAQVVVSAAALLALWTAMPGAVADPAPSYPTDERGFVNTAAHCDGGQSVMMYGRTERALVAVCVGPDGQLQYRGMRLSDRVGLVMGASRGTDGDVVATSDDVTYAVSPAAFLVSEGDNVLYRDTWEEFHQPSSPPPSTTATSAAPTTTSAAPSSTTPTSTTPTMTSPTVSTTTVTLTPSNTNGG